MEIINKIKNLISIIKLSIILNEINLFFFNYNIAKENNWIIIRLV